MIWRILRGCLLLSIPAAGFLGWALLFAAAAGYWWALAGLAFGFLLLIAHATLGMLFEGDRHE